jgi:putative sigma-54 modulation protein
MKIQVTGRHLRLTGPIREYVEEKVLKAQKYFSHIIWAQVLLTVEKRSHQAEIVIHAAKQTFRAQADSADLYAAVDLATDKIDHQLKKYKEKLKERHKTAPTVPEIAVLEANEPRGRISVVKQVSMRPMSSEAAVGEMDRLGYNFWMFQDRDSRQIQVIYRRLDDTFGLLQPIKKDAREAT